MVLFWIIFLVVLFVVITAISQSQKDEKEEKKGNITHRTKTKDDGLSVKDKLILGAGVAKLMDMEEKRYQERKRDREQKRHDDLFWQEAARRKSAFDGEEDSEDW